MFPELPLSAIYRALRRKRITVNGARAVPERHLEEGDCIAVDDSLLGFPGEGGATRAEPPEMRAQSRGETAATERDASERLAPLILASSADLLVLNKPRGMPAHGEGGLDRLVRAALASRSAASLSFFPGPLHRLDRNTSGLIVFPRSARGARSFTEVLRSGGLRKRYLALLEGLWPLGAGGASIWEDRLVRDKRRRLSLPAPDGRLARATACPLLSRSGHTLALIDLETGLTHQIRAQAAARGLPLAGDTKYGAHPWRGGYILHAWILAFAHPLFPDLPKRFEAPLPASARERLAALFGATRLDAALDEARK